MGTEIICRQNPPKYVRTDFLRTSEQTHFKLLSTPGRNHSVGIDNSTFERVEEFKYFGATLTNQNSIPEEIKSRLRSGNACYHSVQNRILPDCYQKI